MALITLGANSGKGKVLQVVRNYVANQSSHIETTTSSFTASGIQASITPTASGNLILIDFNTTMQETRSTGFGTSRMYQRIGSGSFAQMTGADAYHVAYSESSLNRFAPICFGGSYTATSTDTLTYEPYIYAGTSNAFRFVHQNASYSLTLTEVEQ